MKFRCESGFETISFSMDLINDPKIYRPLVLKAIKKFGHAPEHNADWFLAYANYKQTPIAAIWPGGETILAYQEEKAWYTFSEPLADESNKGRRVVELTQFVFKNFPEVKKIVTESRQNTRTQILKLLSKELKTRSIYYTLIWPVMDMAKFNPALPGRHFKYLRNAKNKFYREHKIIIKNASLIGKDALHKLIDRWVAVLKTKNVPVIYYEPYHNLIDSNFYGIKTARVMIADGQLVGLNAGWEMPNSDFFYAGVGIHDYSISDLGLMLYLEDLVWIKNNGYPTADMGGVEKGSSLNFKNQFLPDYWYKTFVFSIVKSNS